MRYRISALGEDYEVGFGGPWKAAHLTESGIRLDNEDGSTRTIPWQSVWHYDSIPEAALKAVPE
jgi:hypothetical protein